MFEFHYYFRLSVNTMQNVFRNIPSVNELLENPQLRQLVDRANRTVVVSGVRSFLENMRQELKDATADVHVPTPAELAERIAKWIQTDQTPTLRPVINATGILLHTGLGRAPLAQEAIKAMADVSGGYASLEVDLASGKRSQRMQAVSKLLIELTGAEAAFVVNNNAAATMITLSTVAAGKEVIVSRGQLVEIGGSYRLPDVMQQSGARLKEVGTTNKTRIDDFRNAIGRETAALMRVHTSNYSIVGFTSQPTLAELCDLARRRNVPLIDDIGSGALIDFAEYGITDEPLVTESIKTGADLVLFSGDKLLGGPQCGIIAGRANLIEQIAAHPLARALRVDKMTLAALAATLRLYQDPTEAKREIPLLALLSTSLENLQNRAERIAPQLAAGALVESAEAVPGTSYLGGGSVPGQQIETWCVAISPKMSVDRLAAALRTGAVPVVGRVSQDRLLIDLRTVLPHEDLQVLEAFERLQPQESEASHDVAADDERVSTNEA